LLSVEALANKAIPSSIRRWSAPGTPATGSSSFNRVGVQPGDDLSYRINWLGAKDTGAPQIVRMVGRLARVGDQRILDLTASDPGAFAIPCHAFLRIRPVKEGLKVQFVDSKWIRGQVTASLASFVQDDHLVLTAPAPAIEAFLLKFGFDERALDDPLPRRPLNQN
jgi:hypothetical protein